MSVPHWGAYNAPPDPLAGFTVSRGPFRGRRGMEGRERTRGRGSRGEGRGKGEVEGNSALTLLPSVKKSSAAIPSGEDLPWDAA